MTGFKPKNIKKIGTDKKIESLDHKHEEFIEEFNDIDSNILPNFLKERKDKLEKYNNLLTSFDEKLEIKDQIKDIDKKIKDFKNKKKEYYLKNSSYIFNYFEKENISKGASKIR